MEEYMMINLFDQLPALAQLLVVGSIVGFMVGAGILYLIDKIRKIGKK